jgi:hypothetical protein
MIAPDGLVFRNQSSPLDRILSQVPPVPYIQVLAQLSQKFYSLRHLSARQKSPLRALQLSHTSKVQSHSLRKTYLALRYTIQYAFTAQLYWELSWVYLTVDQFVLISGSTLGPMTRFYPYPFFSNNCLFFLPVGRPLWREDGSVTYSAIAD